MSTFLLIFFVMVMFHYVYEGIIAPSLRLRLRFKLFEERDRLRSLRLAEPHRLTREVFDVLHGRLNNAVRLLPAIQMSTLIELSTALNRDPDLRECTRKRSEIIARCQCPYAVDINNKVVSTVNEAFVVNSIGLAVWVVPVIGAFFCFHRIALMIADLLLLPPRAIDQSVTIPPESFAMS